MHTDVDACDRTRGLYGHRKRVCTSSGLWEKNPLWQHGLKPASVFCLDFQWDALPNWAIPAPKLELLYKYLCNKVLCCFRLDFFRMQLHRFVLAQWGTGKRLAYNVICIHFWMSLTQTARRKMADSWLCFHNFQTTFFFIADNLKKKCFNLIIFSKKSLDLILLTWQNIIHLASDRMETGLQNIVHKSEVCKLSNISSPSWGVQQHLTHLHVPDDAAKLALASRLLLVQVVKAAHMKMQCRSVQS